MLPNMLPKAYVDTSVVIAVANPEDDFHSASVNFIEGLQTRRIPCVIGSPVMLEIAKTAQRRGLKAALTVIQALESYKIELVELDSRSLSGLVDSYITRLPAGARYLFDLLHYASATLLNCTYLASWDKKHFNQHIQRKVNEANLLAGLTTLRVGDPLDIERALALG